LGEAASCAQPEDTMTAAVQISKKKKGESAGSTHVVGVGDLKVMIVCDRDNEWYAQGLEIDYLAQGTSLANVKTAFERGLTTTIETHLKLFGHIQKLLKQAPTEVWEEFYQTASVYGFTQVTKHDLIEDCDNVVLVATTLKQKQQRQRASAAKKAKKATKNRITELPFDRITYVTKRAA
jgi:hypothetical protein